jgi:hypothetical protein
MSTALKHTVHEFHLGRTPLKDELRIG